MKSFWDMFPELHVFFVKSTYTMLKRNSYDDRIIGNTT